VTAIARPEPPANRAMMFFMATGPAGVWAVKASSETSHRHGFRLDAM
jgi:hypothetical protein